MRAIVTGAAGFIGSHVVERCSAMGWDVLGLDSLSDYYDVAEKRRNVREVLQSAPTSEFVECDLATADVPALLRGADFVFHQAGQPGVRASWGMTFDGYVRDNVLVTQRLLEACRNSEVKRFVYASSSSVYGNALSYPTVEADLPKPQSPYGVTKLAAEHLCGLYGRNFGVPTVSLRYFTVYGPRQRPDMATRRLIESALTGSVFELFGDGSKIRDFTFVADIVAANIAAATASVEPGAVFNIAGGSSCSMAELIAAVAEAVGVSPNIVGVADALGDVERTGGSTALAQTTLGWTPQTSLSDGVRRQVEWQRLLGGRG